MNKIKQEKTESDNEEYILEKKIRRERKLKYETETGEKKLVKRKTT